MPMYSEAPPTTVAGVNPPQDTRRPSRESIEPSHSHKRASPAGHSTVIGREHTP
jgi:hypothetical protein